jgi:menaquinone-specific isochorismate synthase
VTPTHAPATTDTLPSGHVRVDTAGLTTRRVALPTGDPLDPWALAGDDGILLAEGGRVLVGLGTALRLELPDGIEDADAVERVTALLATVTCVDHLPDGSTTLRPVLALGSLPFDRSRAAVLTVPSVLFCREADGTEWATIATGPGGSLDEDPGDLRDRLAARAREARHGDDPSSWRVRPRSSDAQFEDAVARAVAAIDCHEVAKVVLARRVDVATDEAPDVAVVLRRWSALEPSCTLFSMPTPDGQFVGASPELLVERRGDRFRSRPLAGTTDRVHGADSTLPAALLDSTKDAEEHRLVVDAIHDALAPLSDELHVPENPELVHLHNITHLGTTIEGTLRSGDDGGLPSVLQLVALLHPTPAIGGVPREAALDLIGRLEDGSRGHYAGPVGWIDGTGDGRFVVGIRAMTVTGDSVALTAGVGIVSGSRPEVELRETGLKFSAVFDALAPGVTFATFTVPGAAGPAVDG